MLAKLERVRERGLEALRIARAEGVPIVFGTDLLGHMHDRQSGEFALRAPARCRRWRCCRAPPRWRRG